MRLAIRSMQSGVVAALLVLPPLQAAEPGRVAALGRLEPGDGVVDVTASGDQRVQRLEVVEGQAVSVGQALAFLDSHAERAAERDARHAGVEIARLRVQRVHEVGPHDIEALEAEVRRLEAALEVEEIDLERFASLAERQLIPEQDLDRQRSLTRRTRESLRHSQALLQSESRSQRIAVLEAEAQVASAEAELASAEARLERAVIRAPVDGQVLRIFTWPGESVSQEPILRLGETARMYVVAEVYETDVRYVQVGQSATVESPALPGPLRGTVELVGTMIHKNDVLGVDPAAETDARVVEVRVLLEPDDLPSRFVHLQVDVEIDVSSSP